MKASRHRLSSESAHGVEDNHEAGSVGAQQRITHHMSNDTCPVLHSSIHAGVADSIVCILQVAS